MNGVTQRGRAIGNRAAPSCCSFLLRHSRCSPVHEVPVIGDEIDDWEVQIEKECLRLLAMQQPVAGDLWFDRYATMKINYDLERSNDKAVNISQRELVLNELPILKPLIDISRMAEIPR